MAIYGPTFMPTPRTFEKSFYGSDKTKHVKKCGKKMQKNNF